MNERTHFEAINDIRYAQRYLFLQERLFRRMSALFKFLTLLTGSAAFAGFIGNSAELAGIAGLAITTLTLLDHVTSPEQKAMQANELHRRYLELQRLAPNLELQELDQRIQTLREYPCPAIESLRFPAYNQAMREIGMPNWCQKLTLWERFVALLA